VGAERQAHRRVDALSGVARVLDVALEFVDDNADGGVVTPGLSMAATWVSVVSEAAISYHGRGSVRVLQVLP